MDNLLIIARQIQEAYCVRHHIPVEREFSDRELEPYVRELERAEADMANMLSANSANYIDNMQE